MKVACIQLDIKWEDADVNFERADKLIKKASRAGADLICLPELFSTGVTENPSKFAEEKNGRTSSFLSSQAKKNKIYLIGSFIEKSKSGLPKNVAAIYNPKGLLVKKYGKIHLFTFNKEDKYYSGGNDFVTFQMGDFKISPLICYDLRFPEVFRAAVNKGVNVFVVIANWPNPRKDHWVTLLKARAIENQSYVIGVNRAGKAPELSFFGSSMIISPTGEIIAQAGDKEEVIAGEISIGNLNKWRSTFRALSDRRKDCYKLLWTGNKKP